MDGMSYRPTTAVVIFLLSTLTGVCCDIIDGTKFKEDLRHLADDILGADDFQRYLNEEVDYEPRLLGEDLIDQLTTILEHKFQTRLTAVIRMRDAIEKEFGRLPFKTRIPSCCNVPLRGKPDPRFGNVKVNTENVCTFGQPQPATLYGNGTRYLSERILDVMKENLRRVPSLKSQYFGSEQGLLTVYPAQRTCDTIYDPRFRPWYVETVTPEPKDVVVVIDTSGSMRTDNLMYIAIKSAAAVIDTLNPVDRVGIVSFSDEAHVPPGTSETSHCYQTELAKASSLNKKYLKQYVNAFHAVGNTVYSKALDAAFKLLIGSTWDAKQERDKVILFLTDGRPTEPHENIWRAIRRGNAALNNTVVILTFGLGKAILKDEDTLLTEMAHQTRSDPSFGEIKTGKYTKVVHSSNLRYAMTSYYNIFSRTGRIPTPIFSVPYIDVLGVGLITSACLPVFHNTHIQGVTCVDISLADLLSDLTYFQEGEFSYAFMINGQGRMVTHPLLPRPSETYDDPVFVTMTSLEVFPESQAVMKSMIRGETRNGTFSSRRVRARGNTKLEGVIVWSITSKYYWKSVEGTNFSVCLVIGEGDEQAQPIWRGTSSDSFFYHVLHLQSDIKTCNHFTRLVLKDKSCVLLTPEAFEDPFQFISKQLTASDITRYRDYLTGRRHVNPGFKKGIRETVAVTYKLEEIVARHRGYEHAVWLYIGSENGVFRQYPGVRNALRYNHKVRPWYEKAMGQKDHYTISTPYWDASGTGWIITLGVVIYEGRQVDRRPPMGVMAMDFPMSYFYNLLLARYPVCGNNDIECTVIDKSGFIVSHKEFTSDARANEVENIHITVKDPYIAEELINAGIMRKDTCVNHQHLRYQKYWTVTIRSSSGSLVKPGYEVHALEDSNIFIILRRLTHEHISRCRCHTSESITALAKCIKSKDDKFCECPCYSLIQYNFCRAIFSRTSDNFPSCMPDAPVWKLEDMTEAEGGLSSRKNCYDFHCDRKNTKDNCMRVLGCTWCISTHNVVCSAQQDCNTHRPTTSTIKPRESKSTGSTVRMSIISAVSILVLPITVAYI